MDNNVIQPYLDRIFKLGFQFHRGIITRQEHDAEVLKVMMEWHSFISKVTK